MDADPNKQALDAKQTFIFNLNFFCGLFIRVRVHSKLSTDFFLNFCDKLLGLGGLHKVDTWYDCRR